MNSSASCFQVLLTLCLVGYQTYLGVVLRLHRHWCNTHHILSLPSKGERERVMVEPKSQPSDVASNHNTTQMSSPAMVLVPQCSGDQATHVQQCLVTDSAAQTHPQTCTPDCESHLPNPHAGTTPPSWKQAHRHNPAKIARLYRDGAPWTAIPGTPAWEHPR